MKYESKKADEIQIHIIQKSTTKDQRIESTKSRSP